MADSLLDIEYFMAAIRHKESGGDYGVSGIDTGAAGRATGAYQFMDATWNQYGGYARAVDAPPQVQDQHARELMGNYFERYHRWDAVAVAWHAGPGRADDYVNGQLDLSGLSDGLSTTDDYVRDVIGLVGQVPPVTAMSSHVTSDLSDCPVCSWETIDFNDFANGDYPDWALTPVPGGDALRTGAPAESWKTLVAAARADGVDISVSDAYRPLIDQERLARELGLFSEGGLAAFPGTSNHGIGMAVDVNVSGHPAARAWLVENAANYGWHDPIGKEPWHFEYSDTLDPDPERWSVPSDGSFDRPMPLIDLDGDGVYSRFEIWVSSLSTERPGLAPPQHALSEEFLHTHDPPRPIVNQPQVGDPTNPPPDVPPAPPPTEPTPEPPEPTHDDSVDPPTAADDTEEGQQTSENEEADPAADEDPETGTGGGGVDPDDDLVVEIMVSTDQLDGSDQHLPPSADGIGEPGDSHIPDALGDISDDL